MITYLIFIIIVSYAFGQLEIQIEGTAGWAKNLPTWRIENHWALKVFWGGRPLTGYHFWAMIFISFVAVSLGVQMRSQVSAARRAGSSGPNPDADAGSTRG